MGLFTPKNAAFDSHIERAKYLMVYRLTLIFTCVFASLSAVFWNVELFALIGYLAAFTVALVTLIYLRITQIGRAHV